MSKILVIAGDPHTCGLFCYLLMEGTQHEVLGATNASDGLRMTEAQQPDVVLLVLEDHDDCGALERLHKARHTQHIPVVVCTASRHEHGMLQEHTPHVLTKPIIPDELLRTVDLASRSQ